MAIIRTNKFTLDDTGRLEFYPNISKITSKMIMDISHKIVSVVVNENIKEIEQNAFFAGFFAVFYV